jgi:hypothetical protein
MSLACILIYVSMNLAWILIHVTMNCCPREKKVNEKRKYTIKWLL